MIEGENKKFIDCIMVPRGKTVRRGTKGETRAKVLETKAIKKEADFGLVLFFKNFWNGIFSAAGEFKLTLGSVFKFLLASKVGLLLVLITLVIPLTAFEAHVVNVTATIERRHSECPALSIGYWRNHEGCTNGGNGSSVWESQVQVLSSGFSGAFASTTGAQMCGNLWIPNCPSGNNVASKLCKARAQTLADELNIVSSRLDVNAAIAGADDGGAAFDNLGLTSDSTISQALTAIEGVLVNPSATTGQLAEAAHVAERIYFFYEDENPQAPMCYYPGEYTSSGGFTTFACGDINQDTFIDQTDIDLLSSYAFENVPFPDLARVDLNADGVPDILDVTTLINFVRRGGPAPTCGEAGSTSLEANILNLGLPEGDGLLPADEEEVSPSEDVSVESEPGDQTNEPVVEPEPEASPEPALDEQTEPSEPASGEPGQAPATEPEPTPEPALEEPTSEPQPSDVPTSDPASVVEETPPPPPADPAPTE